MSSSSRGGSMLSLLHLVEHRGERLLERERLLDLAGRNVRIFPVLEEARTLVFAHELDEGGRVRLPVHREAFKLFKDGVDAGRLEETDGIFGVLVEVGVENALLDLPAVVADLCFRSGFDLGNEGEPVTRRCPRVKYPSLGMAIAL